MWFRDTYQKKTYVIQRKRFELKLHVLMKVREVSNQAFYREENIIDFIHMRVPELVFFIQGPILCIYPVY